MTYYFDESYYLHSKLAQLKLAGEKAPSGQDWDLAGLNARLKADGLTPQSHYEQWGRAEGLNPNAYFNEYEYLHAKLKQLHSIDERDARGNAYTLQTLKDKIAADGMTAATHYERYGAYETDANGNYLNPSNGFDANAYFWTKLAECRKSGETVHGHTGNAITMSDLLDAMEASGMSPVTHYKLYGANEAGQYSTALVQSVPMSQRVANDPGRETVTDEALPGNYNSATPAPTDNASYSGLAKPGDLGGLVGDSSLSLIPVVPDHSPLIPGQAGYQAPPVTIRDVAVNPIFAPTSTDSTKISGNWLVVNAPRGVAYVIKADGTVLGQIVITVRDNTFSATHDRVFLYTDAALTDASVHKVRQSDLPPSITVDPSKQNNFESDTPPPPVPGIVIAADGLAPGGIAVTNTTLDAGSGLKLKADGSIDPDAAGTYGTRSGSAPAGALAPNGLLDASAVAGTGTLTLDTAALTTAHSVKGAGNAGNSVHLGTGATAYTGGGLNDVIYLEGTYARPLTLTDTAGVNNVYLSQNGTSLTLAGGGNFTGRIGGGGGNDSVTMYGGTVNGYFNLGEGENTIAVSGNAVVGDGTDAIIGGGQKDIITVSGNAVINGGIYANYGDDSITISGGFITGAIAGAIAGGAGDDTVSLAVGVDVSGISGMHGDYNGGNIPGATDVLAVTGRGDLDLSGMAVGGFEILDLGADHAQHVTLNISALDNWSKIIVTNPSGGVRDVLFLKGLITPKPDETSPGTWVAGDYYLSTNGTTLYYCDAYGPQKTLSFALASNTAQGGVLQKIFGADGVTQVGIAWVAGLDYVAPVGIQAADGGGTPVIVSGQVALTGSSVTVNTDGSMILTGESAQPGAGVALTSGYPLYASAATSPTDAVLLLDTRLFAGGHGITGSTTARNDIRLGANAVGAEGGSGNDTFTLYDGHSAAAMTLIFLNGASGGDDVIRLDAGVTGDVSIHRVLGVAGEDRLVISGNSDTEHAGRLLVTNGINLGSGANTLELAHTFVTGGITGGTGAGADNFTIHSGSVANSGAGIIFGMDLGGGANTVTVNGGTVSGFGDGGFGIYADGGGTQVTVNGGTVRGDGLTGYGIGLVNGSHTVTVNGGTVSGSTSGIYLDNGSQTVTVNGGTVSGDSDYGIYTSGGADVITINGGTVSGGGSDPVAIRANPGNDRIILAPGVSISGDIEGGSGADYLDLGGNAVRVRQYVIDSGTFSAPGVETVGTTSFDVITGLAAGAALRVLDFTGTAHGVESQKWNLGAWAAVTSIAALSVGDNAAKLARGTYSAGTHEFTASAGGADALLIYDGNSSTGGTITSQAVVLAGLGGLGVSIGTDGVFAFG